MGNFVLTPKKKNKAEGKKNVQERKRKNKFICFHLFLVTAVEWILFIWALVKNCDLFKNIYSALYGRPWFCLFSSVYLINYSLTIACLCSFENFYPFYPLRAVGLLEQLGERLLPGWCEQSACTLNVHGHLLLQTFFELLLCLLTSCENWFRREEMGSRPLKCQLEEEELLLISLRLRVDF